MSGKKNPNLGDKLRQERQGAENTLRDSRNKAADSSTGDSSKKKAEHRRQIRHEADLAKRIRVCAMPTRIIIPAWRQRILPKVQRKEQPALVPGSSMVESCGSTKSWSGWRKRQIKMP